MKKDLIKKIIKESEKKSISEKELCIFYNIKYHSFSYYKRKYNLIKYSVGCSPNSSKKRVYSCNDYFFKDINEKSSYWAGFIAADGCVIKNTLSLSVQKRDFSILENFKKELNIENPILLYFSKLNGKIFPQHHIKISSKDIVNDLKNNFNIVSKKSLILKPPNIDDIFLDFYIKGYIDGDGSIGLYKNSLNKTRFKISILGTKKLLSKIKNRFKEIYKKLAFSFFKKKNIYCLCITDISAREIFKYYFKLSGFSLNRKWKKEYYDYCIKWIDGKTLKNDKKRLEIFNLLKTHTVKEIAEKYNCSIQNIYYIIKHKRFKNIIESQGEE